ncbi:hypothetical protein GCM10010149_87990 [Nonomuraea roseoviolacea subsp. roseoviolacea]|uniref:ATP-binding protein n=1 Tax=Nonomuraea roseoviolacea TaxID=103837 RepID=UPI0031D84A8B
MCLVVNESISLPGASAAVCQAREYIASEIGKHHPAYDDVVLLTSEAFTNAILHTRSGEGGQVELQVREVGDRVRVAVVDDGSEDEPQLLGVADNPFVTSGRGVFLINAMAAAWGYARLDEAKDGRAGGHLWFEVAY